MLRNKPTASGGGNRMIFDRIYKPITGIGVTSGENPTSIEDLSTASPQEKGSPEIHP